MIKVTHVRLEGGSEHEHITRIRWHRPASGSRRECSTDKLVDWIRVRRGMAVVDASGELVPVEVVPMAQGIVGLRARDAQGWTDHLLHLPRF